MIFKHKLHTELLSIDEHVLIVSHIVLYFNYTYIPSNKLIVDLFKTMDFALYIFLAGYIL